MTEKLLKVFQRTRTWFVVGPWEDRLLAQWVTGIMIAVHWGLGLAILIGGRDRFSLPSYQPLIDLVGGQTWVWGVIIVVSAWLMMTPFKWLNVLGLWIGMCWMIMWMALFAVSVLHYPTAAATAMVAYGGFAMMDAALLTARVLDREE
jgi:hypothetical protein